MSSGKRFVVYGAGAVGGVLGGLMSRSGEDVLLVARGPHLAAIRSDGLRVESPTGAVTVPVPAAGGAAEVDWATDTVVLLAVKSHQTAAALEDLVAHAPEETPVVCVQNGVDNEAAVLRHFARVQATCVMMPTGHLEPGVVEAHCSPVPGVLDTGRFPSGVDDLTRSVTGAFTRAGFASEARPDIMAWKHRKLLMNLGNAVQATCAPGPAADDLRARLRHEGETVLRAAGIAVVTAEEDRARRGDLLQAGTVAGRERTGGSSWQSMRRATGTIESDHLNGQVVLLGRLHGVPTPANELVRRTAVRMARDRAEPGTLDATTLVARLS